MANPLKSLVARPRIELGTRGFSEGSKGAVINDYRYLPLPNFANFAYLRPPFACICM